MKNNSYKLTDSMSTLVQQDSALILIMARFGISLGFGNQTVSEVCRLHQVDERTFLEVVNYVTGRDYDGSVVSLPSLIGYLKQAHDYFLHFNLPSIRRKLIEALDCSEANDIAMLIVKFFDDYFSEVRKHMAYENKVVFAYVEQLTQNCLDRKFDIASFSGKHAGIGMKLKELKDVIIRYYPQKNNHLLNAALLEIIACELDMASHCGIEDDLFVPAVKRLEQKIRLSEQITYADQINTEATDKEKLTDREKDIIINLTRGMSNKEIADTLCLSVHTVTTHRRNISNKLQIHTTAGLIIYAIANNLVRIEDVAGVK